MTTTTAPPVTSGRAVAGLVTSLLCLGPIALGLSLSAMRETKTGERGGHGIAVAGAIIGGLGTVLWLVLALLIVAVYATV